MSVSLKVPYWRLSGFYGLYFALIGCIMPFWGLFLQEQAFDAADIGILLALFSGVRIFAPNLWASISHLVEDYISSMQLLRLGGVLMLVCFVAIYWATEFWHYALIMLVYGFFWSAILPQYEILTLNHTKNDLDAYGSIRLWGSIGFIVLVSLLGWALDFISLNYLPAIMLVLMLAIVFNSFVLPPALKEIEPFGQVDEDQNVDRSLASSSDRIKAGINWGLISFLVITVLIQISHGPYYVFFSIYLQQLDYSHWMIGLLWSLGVFSEIIIFWKIAVFMRRWSLRELVILSLLLTAIRWLMTAYFADNGFILIVSQCLHAFSFGLLHVVSIKYIAIFYPGKQQLQGQALYSGLGFGLGGALGAYLAGLAWAAYGEVWVFVAAAIVALVTGLIAYYALPRGH
ncbi:MAG: PPP family 3-phenylpropionic acid transporter [Oleispira sp.]|jgi:PPP family 3-phenylpropionic acid transporter